MFHKICQWENVSGGQAVNNEMYDRDTKEKPIQYVLIAMIDIDNTGLIVTNIKFYLGRI